MTCPDDGHRPAVYAYRTDMVEPMLKEDDEPLILDVLVLDCSNSFDTFDGALSLIFRLCMMGKMERTVGFVQVNCGSLVFFFYAVSLRNFLVLVLAPSGLVRCLKALERYNLHGVLMLSLLNPLVLCNLIFFLLYDDGNMKVRVLSALFLLMIVLCKVLHFRLTLKISCFLLLSVIKHKRLDKYY